MSRSRRKSDILFKVEVTEDFKDEIKCEIKEEEIEDIKYEVLVDEIEDVKYKIEPDESIDHHEITLCTRTNAQGSNTRKEDYGSKFKPCPECTAVFKFKSDYNRHMMRKHTEDKPFKCLKCEKSFVHRWELLRHESTHTKKKRYACEICATRFAQRCTLLRHLSTVHAKENGNCFKCSECSQTLNHQRNLQRHMLIHKGEKSFKCAVCPQAFYLNYSLKRHLLTHQSG